MSPRLDNAARRLTLLFLSATAGAAQDPPARAPLQFGASAEMVYVRFHVEKKGVFATTLRPDQIRVTEDGRTQKVAVLQTPSQTDRRIPTEITLALDVSSSVLDAHLFDEALVRDVLVASLSHDATVRVCAFGGELNCPTEATRDVSLLMRGFEEAMTFGRRTRNQGTRLYDSLVDILRVPPLPPASDDGTTRRDVLRAVIVMTDGIDTRGGDADDAVRAAVETGARVYAIKLGRAFQDSSPFGGRGFDRPRAMYDYKKFALDGLAKESGGRAWEPGTFDRERFSEILREIAAEITTEIVVGFVPEGEPTGRKRKVKVELVDKSLGTLRNGERTIVR